MDYVEILVRSLIAIAVLLLFCRLVGARQISQLTFYDYVVGITIGSVAGTMCVDRDIDLWYGALAIAIFSVVSILIAFLTSKSIVLRRLFTGSCRILIDNGKLIEKSLRWSKFDVDDVLRELRAQGYFSVSEIRYAILESNGQVSVMPYAQNKPATNMDLNNPVEDSALEANVIIDGKIMKRNLHAAGKSKDWLLAEVKKQNTTVKDTLLATLTTEGDLTLFAKGETCNHNTIFE